MSFYQGKNVLVTGGTGLMGRPLVEKLVEAGAKVTVVSLDEPDRVPHGISFTQFDLRELSHCLVATEGMDIVFHLAGVRASSEIMAKHPASFFVPTLMANTNMMEAARRNSVERYLLKSSFEIYSPADILHEEAVWQTFDLPRDRFLGWACRMAELQAQAYQIEHGWEKISIVRPSYVYGPYDNFNSSTTTLIPRLIKKALDGENPITIIGDGSPMRDVIHSNDVARGMMFVVEKEINEPINLGVGVGVTIKQIAEMITSNVPGSPVSICWDTNRPSSKISKKICDIHRARSYGFEAKIPLEEGIRQTIQWYIKHRDVAGHRYDVLNDMMGTKKSDNSIYEKL